MHLKQVPINLHYPPGPLADMGWLWLFLFLFTLPMLWETWEFFCASKKDICNVWSFQIRRHLRELLRFQGILLMVQKSQQQPPFGWIFYLVKNNGDKGDLPTGCRPEFWSINSITHLNKTLTLEVLYTGRPKPQKGLLNSRYFRSRKPAVGEITPHAQFERWGTVLDDFPETENQNFFYKPGTQIFSWSRKQNALTSQSDGLFLYWCVLWRWISENPTKLDDKRLRRGMALFTPANLGSGSRWSFDGNPMVGKWDLKKAIPKVSWTPENTGYLMLPPPKFNSSTLKNEGWKTILFFWDGLFFRGYGMLNFQGGSTCILSTKRALFKQTLRRVQWCKKGTSYAANEKRKWFFPAQLFFASFLSQQKCRAAYLIP